MTGTNNNLWSCWLAFSSKACLWLRFIIEFSCKMLFLMSLCFTGRAVLLGWWNRTYRISISNDKTQTYPTITLNWTYLLVCIHNDTHITTTTTTTYYYKQAQPPPQPPTTTHQHHQYHPVFPAGDGSLFGFDFLEYFRLTVHSHSVEAKHQQPLAMRPLWLSHWLLAWTKVHTCTEAYQFLSIIACE